MRRLLSVLWATTHGGQRSGIYLFLMVLGLRCCAGGLLFLLVHRRLTAVASLVAAHGLWGARASLAAACVALECWLSSCCAWA